MRREVSRFDLEIERAHRSLAEAGVIPPAALRAEPMRYVPQVVDDIEAGFFDPEFDEPRPRPFTDIEKLRLIDQTLQDLDRAGYRSARFDPGHGNGSPPASVKLGRTRVSADEVGLTITREPADLKGPLGLRLELWWMRRRLWWMRARLDGRPAELFWKGLAPATLGTVGVSAALDASGAPGMWWAMMLAPPIAWLTSGGWRTPTVDKVIREA